MNTVDVSVAEIEPPEWLSRLEGFCTRVLEVLRLDNWEVSLLVCNDEFIRDLNLRFRGKDEPTDVLSFEQGLVYEGLESDLEHSGIHVAGDIVISLDSLYRNAESFSVTAEEELKRLIIHGILHLSGQDHADNSPEQEMLRLQEEILRELSEEKLF